MKDKIIKCMSSILPVREYGKVLYYHSVDDKRRSLPVNEFKKQMEFIKNEGYVFNTSTQYSEKIENQSISENDICITFDDGYEDNYTKVYPILESMSIKCTIFVSVKHISQQSGINNLYENRKMLTEKQIRILSDSGHEIMSHSYSHVNLSKLTKNEIYMELTKSKDIIEKITGKTVIVFSYPNGQKGSYNEEAQQILKKAGYKYAYTTMHGVTLNEKINLLAIPRILITSNDNIDKFSDKLNGNYSSLAYYYRIINGSKQWK